MDDNFSPRVKDVITYSKEEALRLGHDFIGTEHLMLGLLRDGNGKAISILKALEIDLDCHCGSFPCLQHSARVPSYNAIQQCHSHHCHWNLERSSVKSHFSISNFVQHKPGNEMLMIKHKNLNMKACLVQDTKIFRIFFKFYWAEEEEDEKTLA